MKQLIPLAVNQSAQRFAEDHENFRRLLALQGNDATWYTRAFNPYPLYIESSEMALQERLQAVLHEAIKKIVGSYFEDKRIQNILTLPSGIFTVLEKMAKRPYRTGSYRPDFVHDSQGQMLICEINARFPTNAFFISHYINNIAPDLITNTAALKNMMPVQGLDILIKTFLRRLGRSGKTVTIVRGREKGWDISFLLHEMQKANIAGQQIEPEDLDLSHLAALNTCLYLELHQDEFADRLSPQVLERLAISTEHFNDLRTVFLVHDKRFLAVLCDDEIMQDFLTFEDAAFLKKHIIPTYVLARSPMALQAALSSQTEWVLKPNLFGKGQGIVFGKNVTPSVWVAALNDSESADYVLQHYIRQKQFNIWHRAGEDIPAKITEMNIVGTMLCFDDKFFGPGIYRASTGDIVNVAGGGTILFPVLASVREATYA